jgi:two-component system KDP operon response regulator KdpE
VLEVGELRLDFARRLAFVADREVHRTATEYKLFAALMSHEGCGMTHKEVVTTVWGPHHTKDANISVSTCVDCGGCSSETPLALTIL